MLQKVVRQKIHTCAPPARERELGAGADTRVPFRSAASTPTLHPTLPTSPPPIKYPCFCVPSSAPQEPPLATPPHANPFPRSRPPTPRRRRYKGGHTGAAPGVPHGGGGGAG
ncbi:hypothetical protein B0H14DRAFT_3462425 [Mycena olivaceomarginata]|nr:hypothetical protein B0H14DRAFT_3462425 [Mycena olivaceomarginata]